MLIVLQHQIYWRNYSNSIDHYLETVYCDQNSLTNLSKPKPEQMLTAHILYGIYSEVQ